MRMSHDSIGGLRLNERNGLIESLAIGLESATSVQCISSQRSYCSKWAIVSPKFNKLALTNLRWVESWLDVSCPWFCTRRLATILPWSHWWDFDGLCQWSVSLHIFHHVSSNTTWRGTLFPPAGWEFGSWLALPERGTEVAAMRQQDLSGLLARPPWNGNQNKLHKTHLTFPYISSISLKYSEVAICGDAETDWCRMVQMTLQRSSGARPLHGPCSTGPSWRWWPRQCTCMPRSMLLPGWAGWAHTETDLRISSTYFDSKFWHAKNTLKNNYFCTRWTFLAPHLRCRCFLQCLAMVWSKLRMWVSKHVFQRTACI